MTGTYAGQFNMEGFLDYDLPVWIRVLGSRMVGIVPTVYVASYGAEALVVLDEWLNAIQIIQLPFALVPLIKLSCDRNILNEFTISNCEAFAASLAGFGLCAGNYVLLLAAEEQP
jgi:Mn2+/Fe2+ NRAMP family transporter